MSAKNGSTRSYRSSGRLIVCALAALLAMSALFAGTASAKTPPVTHSYLALGDSLAFGYSAKLYKENEAAGDPATAFEAGYVQDYARKLHGAKTFQTQNLGCPGETSASLIGNGPLGAALASIVVRGDHRSSLRIPGSLERLPRRRCGRSAARIVRRPVTAGKGA